MANQFSFRGNVVEVEVLDALGDRDKHGNLIGSETMWFVMNPRVIRDKECFKCIKLYDDYIQDRENKDTNAYIIDIRVGFGVDHYGAELGIFGSKGDGTAIA